MTIVESILSYLAVTSHQRVNMLQMSIFLFDLTCDVVGDTEVNKVRFCSTNFTVICNAVGIFKIRFAASEIGG